jgi:HTH-type transcriptional regulator / antitoxin HigA
MDIRPIRDEEGLRWALAEIAPYFEREPEPGTAEADRFEILSVLIRDYESRAWPIQDADPIEILEFAIEDMGRSQAELARLLGSRSRAAEILGRKRALTLSMIHKISEAWHIPRELLARPYKLEPASAGRQSRRRKVA